MDQNTYRRFIDWMGGAICVLLPLIGLYVQRRLPGELTIDALAQGQWWTLWSGHLLHFTFEHFIWDALMFVVFACVLWRSEGWRLLCWLLVAAPLISTCVFTVEPELYEYRGLSALDTMLCVRFFVGFLSSASIRIRLSLSVLPLCALSLKICYELMSGETMFVADLGEGVVPLPSAHLAGLVLGLLWGASVAFDNVHMHFVEG